MKLPKTMYSALGPVPVIERATLPAEPGMITLGRWQLALREIELSDEIKSPASRWAVLLHEWVHVLLDDSGVQLPRKQEEAVCDAIGTALAAAVLAKRLVLR